MHAHEEPTRKKVKKLAARYSDAEVQASLAETSDFRAFIFEDSSGSASVMFWCAHSGPIMWMDDDEVRVHAQLNFLRCHGYPTFHSNDEIHTYASKHGWPMKSEKQKQKQNEN